MNATPSYVVHVHGQDPQFLVDKIVRRKIYDCNFWKVYCTSLEQDTVIHRVLELFYVGGTFGAYEEPSPFLCLLLKLLQVQPPLELVTGIFTRSTNPHVRVLAAMYTRMVAPSAVIYETLEPLLFDRAPRPNEGRDRVGREHR
ncbi:Pre-mRNA-splicing factor 38 [Carpediemonas membranifera]|uniref:Pre-mRNA-splicing factor 38 n=1 Tax=Carpediemonas membranifera TaxID=201153 RepID=A0A8J6B6M7_9EUKA|nr:Pre-mRNA-splicing factor 38 [Carpediemonas membranifera]|eukprot:KAG9394184.1 Pre-mRNA-splicing factor 38 [Carpediemonas membranifera]